MQETEEESRRTAALALWRYGHDYLKAAQNLVGKHRLACNESQAPYHLAAQGIEFALKSYLRAKGLTPDELNARIGHSLVDALQEALARDLPLPPVAVVRAIRVIAPHHCDDQFRYLAARHDAFPRLAPLLVAGTWVLAQIVADVVADYFAHHAHGSAPTKDDMLRRMRGDLEMTASKLLTVQ